MQVTAFEGIIENGQIRLNTSVHLPEKTKVFVIIPGVETVKPAHIYTRLLHPEQAADFKKELRPE